MANFTNYTKLQLIVERTDLGADELLGGNLGIDITFSGTTSAAGNINILGNPVAIDIGDTAAIVAGKVSSALTALPNIVSTVDGEVVTLIYSDMPYPTSVPTEPEISLGITREYEVTDDRDSVTLLKHSEYEDSESGLKLATEAMYTLVAASSALDTIQMQRVMLSDSDGQLLTTNITQKVVGKNYKPYTVA